MKDDATFSPTSFYGSSLWVSVALGKGRSWFYQNRRNLEDHEGFPQPDAATGLYIKADVEAWINKRRQIADGVVNSTTHHTPRIPHENL